MAFWGIEVKPGKPYIHSFDKARGRLHISQATLAIGTSKQTSVVQCNIGKKSPVLLCALLPDKSESLQLSLEFEEDDEVVFSVIGPRGVYLTGYYVGDSWRYKLDNESESYGEDIANTDTEGSSPRSEEDEYEDSFIDDDDNLEVLPPSPVSTDGAVDEVVDANKTRNKNCTKKRLKKKYQAVESDDDTSSWPENTENCIRTIQESASEDNFPLSSVCKDKRTSNKELESGRDKAIKERVEMDNRMMEGDNTPAKRYNGDANIPASKQEVDTLVNDYQPKRTIAKKKSNEVSSERTTAEVDAANHRSTNDKAHHGEAANNFSKDLIVNKESDHEPGTKKGASDTPNESLFPLTEVGPENSVKTRKKRKERSKEFKILEENTEQAETKADDMDHDLLVRIEHDQRPTDNTQIDLSSEYVHPSVEEGSENIQKKKKRRKERAVPKSDEDNGIVSDVFKEDQGKQVEVKTDKTESMSKKSHERNIPDHKQSSNELNIDNVSEKIAEENVSEKRTKKKKKNRSKVEDDDKNANVDTPILANEEKEIPGKELEEKNDVTASSKVRILSNGLVIEELESGKSHGKAAALGRKLKVLYTAKLKESGQIIDTNVGKAPYKFRLGDQEVIEGWNIGLDGMRTGEKRRLIIPPLMSYGVQVTAENVPPNSWLIYDVELMSVH